MTQSVEVTDIIGSSGFYQKMMFFVSFHSSFFLGTAVVTMDLLAPMVTIYWDWDATDPNRTSFSSVDCNMTYIMELNRTSNISNSSSKLIYETQYSRNTLTEEMNLVCEWSWLVSLANFLSLFGNTFGCLMLRLSENSGRRPLIILSTVASVVLTICMSFPRGYVMFVIAFTLYRASIFQAYMLLFIQAVEVTTPSSRPYFGILVKSGILVGQIVFVGAAWLLKDWFHTQLVQTALVATLLPAVWYLQESPVYLAVRGKYDQAKKVIMKIVKSNGMDLNEADNKVNVWMEMMKARCEIESKAEKGEITDLFKNKRITLYTCGLAYVMFGITTIYNGLVINAESFGSGLYMDLTTSNTFSIIAVLFVALFLKKVSIRVILIIGFLLEGLTCVMYPVFYGYSLARTIISVLSRSFISPLYAIVGIYANEVFPTSVRGVGSGLTGFIAVLLSSPVPFTKELAEKSSVYVPFIMFAIISFTSALVCKLMPDRKDKPIIHTIHDLKG